MEEQSQGSEPGPSRSLSSASRRSSSASTSSRKGKERAVEVAGYEVDDDDPQNASLHGEEKVNGDHGSEGDEDEESSDEEEDDGEEEEPTLKYSRLKGKLPDLLARDRASAIQVGTNIIAIGTENGMVHILSYEGITIRSYRPHGASVTCIRIDEEDEFVVTSSFEGRVVIFSLTSPETHAFDFKRPMRTVSLEPGFAKKTTRALICGGMAGNLVLQEKGWLGYKDQILHSGEGPIWASEWRGNLIAWANDSGVRLFDTTSGQRIGYVDRGTDAPRAELFKCSLEWKDDSTLIIGWADYIKVVRVRSRVRNQTTSGLPALTVELTAIYQVDCMISGISPFGSSYIVLAYIPPDTYVNEATEDRAEQRRRAANRPELRVIHNGEETSADALSLTNYDMYGCNDYSLVKSRRPGDDSFLVISPADVIVVGPRDEIDHIQWLVERQRFEEALSAAEVVGKKTGGRIDAKEIGLQYMRHLFDQGDFDRAAGLAPRVLGQDVSAWEKWIHDFISHDQLVAIAPKIPTSKPRLGRNTYEAVLDHELSTDTQALLTTLRKWSPDLYKASQMLDKVQDRVDVTDDDPVLLECLAELFILTRQPAKALPYLLRLRRPDVFDLIRDSNLFSSIQDQALQLVTFDQERRSMKGDEDTSKPGPAIKLLVDHIHSIPVDRVVKQLEPRAQFLYFYLDSLYDKDPQLCFPYSDQLAQLFADYRPQRLMTFLRTSNFYDLESAYRICKEKDLIPEMVFLLGRMGNNREALMLIIERLGDVQLAIEFATEQADEDLWEDLLQYSETRPDFIRALLEHVGAEINPIRLISRIKDGLEIPGLKPALVKILQASNLQVSLMEGCHRILSGDCASLAAQLQTGQTGSARCAPADVCVVCELPLFTVPVDTDTPSPTLLYLCRHLVHATCVLLNPDLELPSRPDSSTMNHLLSSDNGRGMQARRRELGSKLSYAAAVRVRVGRCPACEHSKGGRQAIKA